MSESKRQLQSLSEALRTDCVYFVGPGTSAEFGLHAKEIMLTELVLMADELDVKSKKQIRNITSHDWREAISALGDELTKKKFYNNVLEALVLEENHVKSIESLKTIVGSSDLIITTNFDSLLERATTELKEKVDAVRKPEDISKSKIHRKRIVKLHGDLNNPDTLVISREDYENSEARTLAILNSLSPYLAGRNLIFIGYSPRDYRILEILQKVRIATGDRIGRIILIAPNIKKVDLELLMSEGINGLALTIDELASIIKATKHKVRGVPTYRWKAFLSANWPTTKLIGKDLEHELAKLDVLLERPESKIMTGEPFSERLPLLLKEADLLVAIIEGRGVETVNPNVLYELGYFVGRHTWKRVSMFVQRFATLPINLQGVKYFKFDRVDEDLIKTISEEVQLVTRRLSSEKLKESAPQANYKSK